PPRARSPRRDPEARARAGWATAWAVDRGTPPARAGAARRGWHRPPRGPPGTPGRDRAVRRRRSRRRGRARSPRHPPPHGLRDAPRHGEHDPQLPGVQTTPARRSRTLPATTSATWSAVEENGAGAIPSVIRPMTKPGLGMTSVTPVPWRASAIPDANPSSPALAEPYT